jgi:isopenicillin-N epimerase
MTTVLRSPPVSSRRNFLKFLGAGAGVGLVGGFAEAEGMVLRASHTMGSNLSGGRFRALREDYLLDPELVYLNHASIGTIPRAVHDACCSYQRLCESNPWLYMWGGAWEEAREDVRTQAAALLGVDRSGVAITHNATEGFNLLAQGLPLGPGDEVLFTGLNHDGASIPFQEFAPRHGYSVRRVGFPMDRSQSATAESILDFHDRAISPSTRLLVVPHIDNMAGLRHPLRELVALARTRGVEWVAVDGAQSAGMIPLHLGEDGVDFYATSTHKWVQSPKGLGLFYLRPDLQDELNPMWVTWGQGRWGGSARAFEDYGTRNLPELMALGDALTVQAQLEAEGKHQRYRELHQRWQEIVNRSPRLTWRSPTSFDDGGMLTAVEVADARAPELGQWLYGQHNVVLRTFGGEEMNFLRVAPNLINSEEELVAFAALLEGAPR